MILAYLRAELQPSINKRQLVGKTLCDAPKGTLVNLVKVEGRENEYELIGIEPRTPNLKASHEVF